MICYRIGIIGFCIKKFELKLIIGNIYDYWEDYLYFFLCEKIVREYIF